MRKGIIIIISQLLIVFSSCNKYPTVTHSQQTSFLDLNKFREGGDIIAISDFSAINYFIYKGEPDGFHYEIVKNEYITLKTGKVSPWDFLIKSFSDTINWDWRLLASLVYQESRFNPTVRSWAGAYGLMQIMPGTGENFGIDVTASPESNVKAGVLYIKYLQDFFNTRIPDENERLKFVLAAYNAGAGNIVDAMQLAKKHGKSPVVWDDNVAYFLLKKMEPFYYNDPVVKNGYCRGDESVQFVTEVLERYSEYKNIIHEDIYSPY